MKSNKQHKGSLPVPSSNLPANETVVSIVRHSKNQTIADDELPAVVEYTSPLGEYEVTRSYEHPYPPPEKQWLEQLLTPWGIGALLLLLLANMLACWAQWSTETPVTNTTLESNKSPQDLSFSPPAGNSPIPTPLNLTAQNSENLTLEQLSLLSVSSTSDKKSAANSSIKPSAGVGTSSLQRAGTNQQRTGTNQQRANNLTNALLPPSLQPHLMQTYPEQVAPKSSLSQILPVTSPSQPQGVAPSIKPAPTQFPTVSQNPDKKALEQQRILEEMRRREENKAPLGFNHKTRAELRSAANREDSTQLIEKLQELQQQRIDEAKTINPQPLTPNP